MVVVYPNMSSVFTLAIIYICVQYDKKLCYVPVQIHPCLSFNEWGERIGKTQRHVKSNFDGRYVLFLCIYSHNSDTNNQYLGGSREP